MKSDRNELNIVIIYQKIIAFATFFPTVHHYKVGMIIISFSNIAICNLKRRENVLQYLHFVVFPFRSTPFCQKLGETDQK